MIQSDSMTQREWGEAIALGMINGILLAVIMVTLKKSGLSPMPAPLGLAFADTISGRHLPLPIGLLFHLAYVTFWSVVFVALFRPHLTFARAAMLAAGLWIFALIVFVPIVGWGMLGLKVGPQIILGLFITHSLFCIFVWGLCRVFFPQPGHHATGISGQT
jgi:hypothetical protein